MNAADMPFDVMKAEVCALYPAGAAQAMKLRTRSEIVHVLAQLYQHGVFICITADKAKKEKWEPQLFDDEVVVVPLRVACRAITEGCVILTQKDKQDAVLWNIPPWRENAGVEFSLQKIWGTAQGALKAHKASSVITSPSKR